MGCDASRDGGKVELGKKRAVVYSVVCLGELLVDCFATQRGLELAQVTQWLSLPGGAPANVACALAKLGTPTVFIGAVGDDRWGNALQRLLVDLQVGTVGLQQHASAPTREVFVLLDESGDRSFAGFSQPDPAVFADAHLQASLIDEAIFTPGQYLVLGTLGLAYPETRASIFKSVALNRAQHGKIVVDINWRPMFWEEPSIAPGLIHELLEQTQILKVAEEEAQWLFDTCEPAVISQRLPHLVGVLVTAGEAGCSYWLAGNQGRVPGFRVDVEETTGAGDAFVAGFVHQLCEQGMTSLRDPKLAHGMVRYASAMGALTTTRAGAIAGQPTAEEVDAFLFLHP
jgi:fructokinase